MSEWTRGRWWVVLDPAGKVWCETSVEREARDSMRPGDVLYKQWIREEQELRRVDD